MPRNPQTPRLSDGQALYIVQRLVHEGNLSPAEVTRYVGEVDQEIRDLEAKLQRLRTIRPSRASAGDGPKRRPGRPRKQAVPPTEPVPGDKPARRRRRRAARTPEARASRQLQGRYLALIRQIPASRRGQYSKTAKEKGRDAAIADMETALRK